MDQFHWQLKLSAKNVTHLLWWATENPIKPPQPSLDAGSYSWTHPNHRETSLHPSAPQSKMTFAFLLELSARIFFSNSFFLYRGCSLVEVWNPSYVCFPTLFFFCGRIPSTYQVSWDQGKMGCMVGSGFQNNSIKPYFYHGFCFKGLERHVFAGVYRWLSPKEN